jgi:hypothetical protein
MRSHRKKRGREMKVPGLPGKKKSRMKRRRRRVTPMRMMAATMTAATMMRPEPGG